MECIILIDNKQFYNEILMLHTYLIIHGHNVAVQYKSISNDIDTLIIVFD